MASWGAGLTVCTFSSGGHKLPSVKTPPGKYILHQKEIKPTPMPKPRNYSVRNTFFNCKNKLKLLFTLYFCSFTRYIFNAKKLNLINKIIYQVTLFNIQRNTVSPQFCICWFSSVSNASKTEGEFAITTFLPRFLCQTPGEVLVWSSWFNFLPNEARLLRLPLRLFIHCSQPFEQTDWGFKSSSGPFVKRI